MAFDGINEKMPKYEQLKNYTTVHVNGNSVMKMITDMNTILNENVDFVPPIFSEYVVRTDDIDLIKAEIEQALFSDNMLESPKERENQFKAFYQKHKSEIEQARYNVSLVRWQTDTSFTILHYANGKKTFYILVEYVFDENNEKSITIDLEVLSKKWSISYSEELQNMVQSLVMFILSVSDFLLNYTDKVQYVTENENGEKLKKTKNTKKKRVESKKSIPKGKKQNVINYRSAIKVYEVDADDVVNYKKRKYRKIKNSWFVRGYYERYGKEKIPKYIPPRINRRNKDLHDAPDAPLYKVINNDGK